uniref:Rab-GAP TBC domain-containing protein n=2 Tax=Globisporangium ultimum (strain ATCC 200006 / CBS 805.95 / DAOM BR144) TaxID=431595 RepID=K3W8M6_GLOUD
MEPNVSAANEDAPSPSASSNPFRNALHKFSKKKEKSQLGSSATSGFFSRASKGKDKPVQGPLPGSVKQVSAGQLPPVWVTPVPAPPRKMSSPTNAVSKSPRTETRSYSSEHEEDVTRSVDHLRVPASSTEQSNASTAPTSSAGSSGASRPPSRNAAGNHRSEQFHQMLKSDVVDLDKMRELSWGGIPVHHRPTAWRLLLGYMPSKQDRREAMLQRKRQEYVELLQQYYYIPDTDRGAKEQTTLRQILVDIPRTNADVKLFQEERIHQLMERVLYTWAIRHPASGYVQGINDLLTPFLVVFLSAYVDEPQTCDLSVVSDESLQTVEADSYWCLTKLLDGIQDHYTFAQPGLQRMVQRMEELVHRCDGDLFKHIVEREGVQFVQFAFRWMNCLLMREVPLNAIIRLWDTYLCEDSGFESFHVYVCAAILMTFGEKLKTLEFQDLVLFLQHLPTKDWVEDEIDPLLSRAFILQTYFADSPSHLS